MEIRFHTGKEVPVDAKPAVRRDVSQSSDESSFNATEGLSQALDLAPDVRPETVNRAERLFVAQQYPPPELIGRIARLLGERWPASE